MLPSTINAWHGVYIWREKQRVIYSTASELELHMTLRHVRQVAWKIVCFSRRGYTRLSTFHLWLGAVHPFQFINTLRSINRFFCYTPSTRDNGKFLIFEKVWKAWNYAYKFNNHNSILDLIKLWKTLDSFDLFQNLVVLVAQTTVNRLRSSIDFVMKWVRSIVYRCCKCHQREKQEWNNLFIKWHIPSKGNCSNHTFHPLTQCSSSSHFPWPCNVAINN